MSFVEDLRMNNIYGNMQPPNLSGGINLDEISALLNRVRNYRSGLLQDAENIRPFIDHSAGGQGNPKLDNISSSMHQPQSNAQPNVVFNPGTGATEQFTKNILNPPERGLPFQKLALDAENKRANVDIKKEQNDIKQGQLGINQQRANTGDWRASIADFKSKNPGAKIIAPKGGNFQLVNPVTHEITDSGISTGSMTDKDRYDVMNDNAIEQIGARGAQARETQGEGIAKRGKEARITKQAPSGQSQLATQQGRDQFNKAQQIVNSDTELGKFIKIDPNTKTFTVDQPSSGFFGSSGPSAEQLKKINESIYGATPSYSNRPQSSNEQRRPIPKLDKDGKPIPGTESGKFAVLKDGKWVVE